MRVVFRKRVEADIRGIIAWFEQIALGSVQRILYDIYRSIGFLIDSPRPGMPIDGTLFHRFVTRHNRFKITCEVKRQTILVVGSYRFQKRAT